MQANWIPRANRFSVQEREARCLADTAKRKESREHWQRLAKMLEDIHAEIFPTPPPPQPGDDWNPEMMQWKYIETREVAV